jgi:hypothetical protein
MVCARLSDVVPLCVESSKLLECLASGITEHIVLKYGSASKDDDDLPSGSFGAIDLDGSTAGGANDYETWLSYGFSGQLAVASDLFPVEYRQYERTDFHRFFKPLRSVHAFYGSWGMHC